MSLPKLTNDELQQIAWGERDDLVIKEEGTWLDGGKFQYRDIIFQDVATEKYYLLAQYRTGNHWNGYEYEYPDQPYEVEQKEVVIKNWVACTRK